MFRKLMLAGLMTATVLGGVAPAYAQRNDERRDDRGERAARPAGEGQQRGNWQGRNPGQPRQDVQAQRWQQRGNDRPTAPVMARPQPDDRQVRGDVRQNVQTQRWQQRGNDRPVGPVMARPMPDDRQGRGDNRNDRRDPPRADRQDGRPDWRDNRRDDNRNWQNRPRDDRPGQRQDWRNDRRDDQRWNNGRNDWRNDGRRYDDRTRWSAQRRWDNGWRQDRRYDWQSYRSRYGDRYRAGRYYAPRGWDYGYRRFSVGIVLSSLLYSNNYWLNDPYAYRLPPAYGTLRWVRYYDDALLVDIRDGYVVDVINDFFW